MCSQPTIFDGDKDHIIVIVVAVGIIIGVVVITIAIISYESRRTRTPLRELSNGIIFSSQNEDSSIVTSSYNKIEIEMSSIDVDVP